MNGELLSNAFLTPAAIGLSGVALWFVKSFASPADDRFTSIFRDVAAHGRSLFVGLLGYAVACVGTWQVGHDQFTALAAIGLGYACTSVSNAFLPAAKPTDAP